MDHTSGCLVRLLGSIFLILLTRNRLVDDYVMAATFVSVIGDPSHFFGLTGSSKGNLYYPASLDSNIGPLRNEPHGPQGLRSGASGPKASQRSDLWKQNCHWAGAMHVGLNLGRQDVHADALLANHAESEIEPLYQDPCGLRCGRICRHNGHLLCSLLPTVLTVLGHAGG